MLHSAVLLVQHPARKLWVVFVDIYTSVIIRRLPGVQSNYSSHCTTLLPIVSYVSLYHGRVVSVESAHNPTNRSDSGIIFFVESARQTREVESPIKPPGYTYVGTWTNHWGGEGRGAW